VLSRRQRGSVLVLVVATLGLLAVIGTVYIVTARTERGSAAAAQSGYNFELAQDAIHRVIGETLSRTVFDAQGNPGGPYYQGSGSVQTGFQAARRFTMPQFGSYYANGSFGVMRTGTGNDFYVPSEPWLCSTIYRPAAGTVPDANFVDLSVFGPFLTNGGGMIPSQAFNPSTGQYDIPYVSATPWAHMFKVVADPLPALMNLSPTLPDGTVPPAVSTAPFDALVQLLPYSDASGIRYRYGARVIDTGRMANLNTGLAHDGSGVIPDPFGVGANAVTLGLLKNSTDILAKLDDKTAFGRNGPAAGANTVGPGMIFTDTFTANNSYVPFDLADELELRSYGLLGTSFVPRVGYQLPGDMTTNLVWPRTFQDSDSTTGVRKARQYYTTWSYAQDLRMWPTFSDAVDRYVLATDTANANTPTTDAQDALNAMVPASSPVLVPGEVFPIGPSRLDLRTNAAGLGLAISATNLATVMRYAGFQGTVAGYPGFSPPEINSFFVNYLTYRDNDWHSRQIAVGGGTVDVWSMITVASPTDGYGGPAYIDNVGFVMKPGLGHDPATGAITASDLPKAAPLNFAGTVTGKDGVVRGVVMSDNVAQRYIGYAAQPFINEVAYYVSTPVDPGDPTKTLDPVISEISIELANPYGQAMDLTDYFLRIETQAYTSPITGTAYTPGPPQDIDLATYASATYIPPKTGKPGYFVLSIRDSTNPNAATSHFAPKINAQAQHQEIDGLVDRTPAPRTIRLYRKYGDRINKLQKAQIDGYDTVEVKAATLAAGETEKLEDWYFRRDNDRAAAGVSSHWAVAVHTAAAADFHIGDAALVTPTGTAEELTLGDANPATAASLTIIPLEDRTIGGANKGRGFETPNEFNKLMRISHIIDAATGDAVATLGAYPTLLLNRAVDGANPAKEPIAAATEFPADAVLHFDFRTPAYVYEYRATEGAFPPYTAPPYAAPTGTYLPSDRVPGGITPTYKPGDFRANYLLENITFTTSNAIAGQINVNTAPFEVLCTIAPFGVGSDAKKANWACAVLAYRYRSRSDGSDPRIPNSTAAPISGPVYDFSNDTNNYPGYGIRSLGELNWALTTKNAPTTTTLADRDVLWSAIYNTCTVRSDTFVVYGYLEAVRQNPRYTGAFDNALDWYRTGVDATNGTKNNTDLTDDPNNAQAKLLRVGRRRWVALMDRTPVYNGGTPRVIAVKVLPN
jgi:hypothetical protein